MNTSTDFKQYLKSALAERIQANPQYSLRAFARDLNVSASVLSEVLNNKHGLSVTMAKRIAKKLGLTTYETDVFCNQIEAKHARSKHRRDIAQTELERIRKLHEGSQLQMDAFKIISDWYHYAILELTYLEDFVSDPLWISTKLGITKLEVEVAIERMQRLGLLITEDGRLEATEDFTASPDGVPSEALRKFHRQLLTKALEALTMDPVEERDITSLIVAVDRKRLPEAKQKLKEFRREFNAQFSEGPGRDGVYCLGLQFFELTK